MKLPLTSYDRLKKIRPKMWAFISQDFEEMKKSNWEKPIFSMGDIGGGRLKNCLTYFGEEFIRETAERSGLSVDEIRSHAVEVPEFLQQLRLITQSIEQDYYNCLNFELFGRKTFYFSDALTDNLAATEIEIDSSFLRPPFDCSMFVFTAKSIINAACSAFGRGIQPMNSGGVLSVMAVYHSDRKTKNCSNFSSLLMAISYWEGNRQLFYVKREVALFAGGSLEHALKTEWNDLLDQEDLGKGKYISSSGDNRQTKDEEFYTDGLHLFRIILNAILYLGSSDPEIVQKLSGREAALDRAKNIKSSAKSKAARKEASRESSLNFALVGESVAPILVTPRSGDKPSSTTADNRTIFSRFIVRGHWRNQSYGEGRSKRKIIWIKPHYKGPEISEIVHRPYIVR